MFPRKSWGLILVAQATLATVRGAVYAKWGAESIFRILSPFYASPWRAEWVRCFFVISAGVSHKYEFGSRTGLPYIVIQARLYAASFVATQPVVCAISSWKEKNL